MRRPRIELNRTPYLWTLFAIGVISYLIQIRGQNIPLWIIVLAVAGMTIFYAALLYAMGKAQTKAQKAGAAKPVATSPAGAPDSTAQKAMPTPKVKALGKLGSKK